jgi:hypothetical protein
MKSRHIRGLPKDGECRFSRGSEWFTRAQVESGQFTCECGAVLKLRRLAPGMKGEPRVSDLLPSHKAVNPAFRFVEWKPSLGVGLVDSKLAGLLFGFCEALGFEGVAVARVGARRA